eukprot:TRINITY_DN24358_c0_g1_i1.p1 TRINITY_DN24358_c0_g1~~TRINITY_DN24358_c0_g1_i1.p1  ORF type:complete len:333 (+),score=69.67 TRINITY_DN24358_c0_g1_i1:139-1137(+)
MSVGGRGINPGSTVWRCEAAAVEEELPNTWPGQPHSSEALQEKARAFFAGEEPEQVTDDSALKQGKWYRFQEEGGSDTIRSVFVHNYTLSVKADPPPNSVELTKQQKQTLGIHVKEVPAALRQIYDKKIIPIVYGSEDACDVIRNFAIYEERHHFLDTSKLKRVTAPALEECRQAIVCAMRYGKMLCLNIGDPVCELQEKICVSKNRGSFPAGLFQHGGLDSELLREKMYQVEDKDGGQCVMRDGFGVFLLAAYDGSSLAMSSARNDELRRIPGLDQMEEVRMHCDEDCRPSEAARPPWRHQGIHADLRPPRRFQRAGCKKRRFDVSLKQFE